MTCPSNSFQLVISSANRDTGTYSNGSIPLQRCVTGCKELQLLYAGMPNDADVFSGVNFIFEELAGGGQITITITGSFTSNQMADYIETQLNILSPNGAPNYIYTVIAVGYNNTLLISNAAAGTFRIHGNLSEVKIGFPALTAYATTQAGTNKMRLNPPLVMVVRFKQLSGSDIKVVTDKNGMIGHYTIPMVGDSFSIVDFQKASTYNVPIPLAKNTTIQRFNYFLLDASTGSEWLIQSDWSMTLMAK